MNFERFLTHQESDYKGRYLKDIWGFSDEEIERHHNFIQLIFPLDEPSQAVFHGLYLNNPKLIESLRSNPEVSKNILKSADWYFGFLSRNDHWITRINHNHLRITRTIKCLRLLVSNKAADSFLEAICSLIPDIEIINNSSLNHWHKA